MIENGETEQLEKDMLNEIEGGDSVNCSPLESKENDNLSIGFRPFRGLLYICSAIAIFALSYKMICLLVNNVETLTSHTLVTLTQLWIIWRWTTTYFSWCCSKLQLRSMRVASTCTETRNTENTVTNSQQIPVVVELVDIVLSAHAS